MSLGVTGATGLVGRFVVEEALARGEPVTVLGRTPPPGGFFSAPVAFRPYALGDRPDLCGLATLVHCAFSHVPGRYRGGEGNDPEGFTAANLDGSVTLFRAARDAGVGRFVFLSTRAVYGRRRPGTDLTEDLPLCPDTLYGEVKAKAEAALFALAAPGFTPVSLRATGVYGPAGPGQRHKWAGLFDDFRNGRPIAPRRATEVHGRDLADAIRLLRGASPGAVAARAFNLSDILLDRHDLLAMVAEAEGLAAHLPARDPSPVSVPDCTRLHALGWRPGGMAQLAATLRELL